ncbi:MAG: carbon starvation protein A [Elusimicrobia bacterium]|nr:carbon starvation protein A [Elusimicrobiota bacterium]
MLAFALIAAAIYLLSFFIYGRWLSKIFALSSEPTTPAHRLSDGQDYVPTRPAILLSQHFAAIAAVGPIAGPILAGAKYGWLPGALWITLGAVFIGAVHDFSCLVASVRHDARSIGDVIKIYVGRNASILFSLFIWLNLIYVIVVFTDLTASAFVNRPEFGSQNFGPGVATSSLLYLGLAVLMGFALNRWKWSLKRTTTLFVLALFVVIWLGQKIPITFSGDALSQQKAWDSVILIYCFAASVIPLWVLLQPRGYLGGFILYTTFAAGVLGLAFGKFSTQFPLWNGSTNSSPTPLFPLLFTTIACGACSGFHGLVSSGTTSKQLDRETDARTVGYGGMLLEGFVAVIALSTLMLQAPGSPELSLGPDEIYARGLAHFMSVFGIPFAAGVTFGKLAFATFIYDTLDVTTRLGRYILQELLGLPGKRGAFMATGLTLAVPAIALWMTFTDPAGKIQPMWKVFWPAFGASNQLLAALSLAGITVWLRHTGRNWWVTGIPAAFMTVVTLSSLAIIVRQTLSAGRWLDPVGTTAILLLILALIILFQTASAALRRPPAADGILYTDEQD